MYAIVKNNARQIYDFHLKQFSNWSTTNESCVLPTMWVAKQYRELINEPGSSVIEVRVEITEDGKVDFIFEGKYSEDE